jgi:hypothetical protein
VAAEALDSVSSNQLASYIEERVGKKYNWTQGVDPAVKNLLQGLLHLGLHQAGHGSMGAGPAQGARPLAR